MSAVAEGLSRTAAEILEGAFLFCAECGATHRVSRLDRCPVYLPDGSETAADDAEAFLRRHAEHRLRLLRRSSEAELISHPRWDPMCRVTWELNDGDSTFLVSFGRRRIDEPREYTVSRGRLRLERELVEVDADSLHRVIDEALYPHAAPTRKIDALVDVCRRLAAATPIDSIEPLEEARDDPQVQLACLPEAVLVALAAEVRRLFADGEAECVLEVVDRDLRREIPVLRLKREYRIETHG